MNILHVLFFCFLSALCGGKSGLVRAQVNIYTGAAGGNGSINCHLTPTGSWKFFCKGECKGKDILIKTNRVRANKGRYSVKYKKGNSGKGILSVTITRLSPSDSGRYRCGLGGSGAPGVHTDFEIRVSNELERKSGFIRTEVEGGEITYGCKGTVHGSRKFFCRNKCQKEEDVLIDTYDVKAQRGRYSIKYRHRSVYGLYVTITQVTVSDSGWYRCGYGRPSSPDSVFKFEILIIDASSFTPPPTQGLTSMSGSCTSSDFCETTVQLIEVSSLAGCLLLAVLLLFVLLLYFKLMPKQSSDVRNIECITYENCPSVPAGEDSNYQGLEAASRDPDSVYESVDPAGISTKPPVHNTREAV
ncbi:polymeric immunoglobulin receptor-like [Toxotes jaculatrix]|uniref:polymeric immunoglobulin receptor-like n=1 Tax=Toxotes jaculatrix TaxID=941984 RepID=UPI001B3AA475|nr:polymeric immunoglobulin receptor-like [Toxotes jaculatrix]